MENHKQMTDAHARIKMTLLARCCAVSFTVAVQSLRAVPVEVAVAIVGGVRVRVHIAVACLFFRATKDAWDDMQTGRWQAEGRA